jgi:hypothetical protein
MAFGYAQPFTFKIGGNWAKIGGNSAKISGNPVKVAAIRNGVTEVILRTRRFTRRMKPCNDLRKAWMCVEVLQPSAIRLLEVDPYLAG